MKKLINLFLVLVMVLSFAQVASAGYSSVGVAASTSYVDLNNPKRIIIVVGDSRLMFFSYGTPKKAHENFVLCYVNGGGSSIIDRKTGQLTPVVNNYIQKYRKYDPVIVLTLGVNDNAKPKKNAKRLIERYSQWMAAYPDLDFLICDVGPTIMEQGSYTNANIIKLNKALHEEYDSKGIILNEYDYLLSNNIVNFEGKGFRDKNHYNPTARAKILKFIRSAVNQLG